MAVRGISGPFPPFGAIDHAGYVSGRWYGPPITAAATTNTSLADTLYLLPVPILQRVTIDQIAMVVGTLAGAAANARAGVYQATSNGSPAGAALIAASNNTGDMNQAAGTNIVFTFAASFTVSPGVYWFGAIFDNTLSQPTCCTPSNFHGGGIGWHIGGNNAASFIRNTAGVPVNRITQTAAAAYGSGMPATVGAVSYGVGGMGSPWFSWRAA